MVFVCSRTFDVSCIVTVVAGHGPDKFWERMLVYSEIDKTGELGPFSVNVKSFGRRPNLKPKKYLK